MEKRRGEARQLGAQQRMRKALSRLSQDGSTGGAMTRLRRTVQIRTAKAPRRGSTRRRRVGKRRR